MVYERVTELREQKGLSQRELADLVGVSKQFISFAEKGFREPGTDVLKRIAIELGCSTDYLLGMDKD